MNSLSLGNNGFVFHCVSELAGVSGTDHPCVLFINPANSGVNMSFLLHLVGTESTTSGLVSSLPGIFLHRFYANPTVTANGTALSIVSSKITASPPVSAVQAFSLPTVAANGSKVFAAVAAGASEEVPIEGAIVIQPGNSMLVTCTPSNPTTLNPRYLFQWVEL